MNKTLDPSLKRILKRGLATDPYPTAIPFFSTEPLYGLGVNGLKPLYVRSDAELGNDCLDSTKITEFCLASVRNNPDASL